LNKNFNHIIDFNFDIHDEDNIEKYSEDSINNIFDYRSRYISDHEIEENYVPYDLTKNTFKYLHLS
jgi:hypothetical protein